MHVESFLAGAIVTAAFFVGMVMFVAFVIKHYVFEDYDDSD